MSNESTIVVAKYLRPLILSGLLGIAVYVAATLWLGAEQWSIGLRRISSLTLIAVLSLSLLNYLLRFLRWQTYLHILDHRVPWLTSMGLYATGFAFTVTPGKAGEMIRSYLLKPFGVGYSRSLGALLAERISDLLAIATLALGSLYLYPHVGWLVITIFVVIVGLLAALSTTATLRIIERLVTKIPIRAVAAKAIDIVSLFHHASILNRKRYLISGWLIGIVAWGAEGLGLYLITHALGLNLAIDKAIIIYAASLLIGAISFVPGGLGSTEGTLGILLVFENMSRNDAIIAALICRATTLWFAVALGIAAFFAITRSYVNANKTLLEQPCK